MAKLKKFPKTLYVHFDDNCKGVLLAEPDISDCPPHSESKRVARYTLDAVGLAVNTTQWIGPTASTSRKKKTGKTR